MVGEGADEILGGYRRCLFYYLYSMNFSDLNLNKFIFKAQQFMQTDSKNILLNYYNFKNIMNNNKSDIEDLSSESFLNVKKNNVKFLDIQKNTKNFFKEALISHMTKRDLPYVLRMEDKNSMSQGIEARIPFLDHKFVEYIYKIKTKYFMKDAQNKNILRTSFKKYFSDKVLSRKDKSARPGNNSYFMFSTFNDHFLDLLNNKNKNQFFNIKNIKLNFERDKKKNYEFNANFYFRAFNYLVWKDNFNI
jgi:asparagine synthase (glutamine-hydrolysing)